MVKLKLPPRIKVLEALGAISDGRIKKKGEEEYEVISSEGDRKYRVFIRDDSAFSDDNGTKFRGYVGYPIIAVLMLEGKLSYSKRISEVLKGIDWRKLNETYKNYAKVEDIVLKKAEESGISRDEINKEVEEVINELRRLSLKKIAQTDV
ncbi:MULTISPECIES: hypothetical protein [Acidianus]|uniref:Uncharacterized protein n=1 Tax=Candidatus Acidianus copahuensis TaxID=1160895 RepID=A0A031LLE8_9CREN|nr:MULTISPECIES: hypothetical protein [Acidianus]EZQ01728.1 hypothetical protein CM19_12360 [Candidatus Acidianus copahuensis]NON61457.1 hypothetical protein [Acidianus sp. RZ1]